MTAIQRKRFIASWPLASSGGDLEPAPQLKDTLEALCREHFSAGANLMLLLMEAQEGNWDEIDAIVRQFQSATNRLEQCAVPVVTVPHGLTLAGGCEVIMAGNAVRAAAESYVGMVEVGAGVGPVKRPWHRGGYFEGVTTGWGRIGTLGRTVARFRKSSAK